MPKVKMPKFHMPKVEMPRFHMPKFQYAEIPIAKIQESQKWDENFGKLIFANFFITSSIFLCQI